MFYLGFFLGLLAGMLIMDLYRRKTDEECSACRRSFEDHITELNTQIHGLKSSKGALGKELQAMAFRNAGFNAR